MTSSCTVGQGIAVHCCRPLATRRSLARLAPRTPRWATFVNGPFQVWRRDAGRLGLTAAAPAQVTSALRGDGGRRMAWKQRPIGGIEVGRAFSVLLITAVTGMYVISTGERVVGALVILASLALFAAVWIG